MLASLQTCFELPDHAALAAMSHVLIALPASTDIPEDCPERALLLSTLARRRLDPEALADEPVMANSAEGGLRVWLMLDRKQSTFANHSLLCDGMTILLDEEPAAVDLLICSKTGDADWMAEQAGYVALANGTPLPNQKKKDAPRRLEQLNIRGVKPLPERPRSLAEGNLLARTLIALPPNSLTPSAYRTRIATLANENAWQVEEFDLSRLRTMGAGAFVSVAQGSEANDAAIVRISFISPQPQGHIALVGKGICFDTGGHNLKSAETMIGMHEDMAGSATVLGILLAATRLALPLRIDAWLALASNDISPRASRQGDVVTALDGTTIEIVHTDAEGRMVLADTLALAGRSEPDLMVDFGTLTYTMIQALGCRYSGVFASSDELAGLAVQAGSRSGERVACFPMDDDYEEALDSTQADICQCSLDDDAPDHIHAALFLKRFVGELPWLHVDLSAASCDDGLGAIATDQTGFGVAWGVQLLQDWLQTSR
ncbi:leucyl aminopeptidase family protein [Dechloromonas denitrificans]|uniref:M17 family metallopeptidase n=1 Tax=Dechloromonas denitrificans TaxID=281362 RepID=UPI001CF8ED3B|nr:leucyl aminopeptidase family protein [Dechloromonas denitrificans]UCV12668.1 leucyl aminopeptidase family protein [Dechloromonas denitrificans]